jgi:shikimate kinase
VKIYLIGLPGSGKSRLGRALADHLRIDFIDLDTVIEKVCGKSVSEIFSEKGEAYFRKTESEQLHRLGESMENFVMATGGGSPCFHHGIEFMNRSGRTLFLDAPVSVIADRLTASNKEERPLLTGIHGKNLIEKLQALREERIRFYSQATFVITKDQVEVSDVVNVLNIKK